ncbi:MAG TPA: urease accessory protein UreH [Blastocatellia bacterium]|nr:urease accessory protein UreH [Blastocatellia bacterium]
MNTSIAFALAVGFLRGLQHALDPDHVVAVSTIVSEHKSLLRSSLVGTFWGLGHTAALVVVSLAIILLRPTIPDSALLWMETPVAVMLIALGVSATWKAVKERGWQIHTHTHRHDDRSPAHSHIHVHSGDEHNHMHRMFRVGRKPFVVGVVHGLAGSAVVTLAALATIPSVALGLVWIALFGIGTIGGMLLMSAAISLPFIITARRFSAINGAIRLLAGLFSIFFGLMIAWDLLSEIGRSNS